VRVRQSEARAEQRVGTEASFVRSAVEGDHRVVGTGLVGGVAADQNAAQLAVHVGDSLRDAFAEVALAAVAQFDCLVLAGGGT